MKLQRNLLHKTLSIVGLLVAIQGARALPFVYNQEADIFVGFRKVGIHAENAEAVADIGTISNYLAVAAGATITVPGFSASQISPDTFTSFNNLTWSAFGKDGIINSGFPKDTIWVTAPRSDPNTQTVPPTRLDDSSLSPVVPQIHSIFFGAGAISGRLGTGPDNTSTFVAETPLNNSTLMNGQNLSVYIASTTDNTLGTFQDQWTDPNLNPINVENTTSSTFTSNIAVTRSDLYEVCPNDTTDPNDGTTSGNAYYVGYFTLSTNGVMSFTRAGGAVQPSAPVISITRSGTTNTISFTTIIGANYFLLSSPSITAPLSSWSSNTTTLSGNGSGTNFQDVTVGTNRYYRVGAN